MRIRLVHQKALSVALFLTPLIALASARGKEKESTDLPTEQVTLSSVSSYGSLWECGSGYETTLILRNGGSGEAQAEVVAYSSGGQQAGATSVEIGAQGSATVSLDSVVSESGSREWGGLVVTWSGGSSITGQVRITDPGGSMISYPIQGGYRYDTEKALSVPWWLPDEGTDGSLSLFNTSSQSMVVSPSISVNGTVKAAAPVVVAANSTKALSLRALLQEAGIEGASVGSLTLRYTGALHALQPSLLLSNAHSGFALMPDFDASHAKREPGQTSWQFPYVPLAMGNGAEQERLESYALLSNESQEQMTPQVVAYSVSGGGVEQSQFLMPVLGPQQTRLVDLTQLAEQLPSSVSRLALTVGHPGQPGDLGISIFSVSPAGQVLSHFEGLILPVNGAAISYWDISGGHVLLHHIKSVSGESASAGAMLYYQTPTGLRAYSLPSSLSVEDDKDRTVNLSYLLRHGVPDNSGDRLPRGVTSGLVVLEPAAAQATASSVALADSLPTCSTSCNAQPASALVASNSPIQFDNTATPACSAPPQIPTADRIVATTENQAIGTGQGPCSGNQAGWIRVVTKIVTDQYGADIVLGGQVLHETVTITSPNGLNISGAQTGTATTSSSGNYQDTVYVCSASCPSSTATTDAQQTITDTVPAGTTYTLEPNTFVLSCKGNTINGQ